MLIYFIIGYSGAMGLAAHRLIRYIEHITRNG